jgi:hypothetical protein
VDSIHRPVVYLKHSVLVTGFCPRLEVEPVQLGPVERAGCAPSGRTQISAIYLGQLSRLYLKTETEFSLRNVVF